MFRLTLLMLLIEIVHMVAALRQMLAPEGSTVTLFCDPLLRGIASQAVWYADGRGQIGSVASNETLWAGVDRTVDTTILETVPSLGSIVIARITREDAGKYWCETNTERGETHLITVAFLLDRFLVEPGWKLAERGDTVILDCNPPPGFPKPTLSWAWRRIDGSSLNSARCRQLDGGHLQIVNFLPSIDAGAYECIAVNLAAEKRVTGFLVPAELLLSSLSGAQKLSPSYGHGCALPFWGQSVFIGGATALATYFIIGIVYLCFKLLLRRTYQRQTVYPTIIRSVRTVTTLNVP